MRVLKLAFAALALATALGSSGYAADMPVKAPPRIAEAATYNWTGLYIGGHIGGAFAGSDFFGNDGARFMGGGQIGFDYQFAPAWVLGVEANYSFVDSNGGGLAFFGNRNLGSVTGRLGYGWAGALLYAKGGYAWADTRHSFGFTGNNGENGYTIGGGVEYMIASNWSAKLEYQYYNLGHVTFISAPPIVVSSFTNDEHTIKLGLNYRFNWGSNPISRGF
jgi:outer membrane immunogenic protein